MSTSALFVLPKMTAVPHCSRGGRSKGECRRVNKVEDNTQPESSLHFLREQLESYRSTHPGEAATVDRLLMLLRDGEPAFHRDHLPGHFTASAIVLSQALDRVLLTHHRKLDIWIQLGGHTDGDTDLLRAARREAYEESGLEQIGVGLPRIVDIDIHGIPAHGSEPAHAHYDVRFAFLADPAAPLVVSDESHDLAWVAVSNLAAYSAERSLHRAVEKAVRMLGGSVTPL